MININKKLLPLLLAVIIMLSSCTGRSTLEEYDAEVKVSVADTQRSSAAGSLPVRFFEVPDPDNSRGLSTERKEHSYGVAKNSQPHSISVQAQQYFSSLDLGAFCYDTVTKEKVLYLTFDCGWENGCTAKILDILKEKNVPAAFFCTLDHIEEEPALIKRMINEGHIVGNHSANHADFTEITREEMAAEILKCENYLRTEFGYAPCFFRFPEGAYNENALDLVNSMGYITAFWSCSYADWDVENAKGGDYAFEKVTSRLHPGAVILLHSVSPDNAEAMGRIIDFARENGYKFRALTDFPL